MTYKWGVHRRSGGPFEFDFLHFGVDRTAVWFFYVDESYDSEKFCLSAIGFRHSVWRECFKEIKAFREQIKRDHGIFIRKEIHAHEFLAGRGRASDQVISKWLRSRIYHGFLGVAARLPTAKLFSVCLNVREHKDPQMKAWDRLCNRIERTLLETEKKEIPKRRSLASRSTTLSAEEREEMEARLMLYHPRAVIFADEGREYDIQKAIRKMSVFNPIPSKFGAWGDGRASKSITIERVLEDPVFKKSFQSHFIQLADCISYALLKQETPPTERVKKYGINKMFRECLEEICCKQASKYDPLGIVRK